MTDRYDALTRAELTERLREELDALQRGPASDAERLAHELSVYQLELEIKNRDLDAASRNVQNVCDSLQQAADDAAVAHLRLNVEGRIVSMDEASWQLLGDAPERLQGRLLATLVHEADRWKLTRHLQLVCAGEHRNAIELRLAGVGGEQVRVRMASQMLAGTEPTANFCDVRMVDITEQRHAESDARRRIRAISRAARFNALGEMASGIAHELSQPLSAIVAYARAGRHLLQEDAPEARQELERSLEKVTQQAERASEIIRRIRGFVRKEPPRLERHAVSNLLQHALAVVDDDIQEANIAVNVEEHDLETRVCVDGIFIEQVMVNLLRNAVESIQATGRNTGEVGIRIIQPGPDWVELSFSDSGEGLGNGDPEQWFMPFATGRRGSLGLGLSLSRSLIEAHGGHLWAEPSAGGGATVRFTLPTEPSA